MSQTKATEELVDEVFLRRLALGQKYTVAEVLAETGGSKETVARHLRTAIYKHADKLQAAKPAPPAQAYVAAEDHVRRQFAIFNEAMSEHIAQATREYLDLLATLRALLQERDADVKELEGELSAANARMSALAAERDQAHERARVAEAKAAQASDLSALVEQLRSMTAIAQNPAPPPDAQSAEANAGPASPPSAKRSSAKASEKTASATQPKKPARTTAANATTARTGKGRARKSE